MNIIYSTFHRYISFVQSVIEIFTMIALAFRDAFTLKFYKNEAIKAFLEICFFSLIIVFLSSFFTGAVLILQAHKGLSFLSNADTLSSIVISAVSRELGPVLTGLVISGRISSSIAAEISTMKATDQTIALFTLSISPSRFLVVPRLVAAVFAMPILIMLSNIVAVFGSYVVATNILSISSDTYILAILSHVNSGDIVVGLVKAAVFGAVISLSGAISGMCSSGSSDGASRATTNAVVVSSILVLFSNYIITFFAF